MSDLVQTIKIKPSHKSQGKFVEINADDYDSKIHEKLSAAELAKIDEAESKEAAADAEDKGE